MSLLSPHHYLESVKDIDVAALAESGIRAMLLDLDNTIMPRDTEDVPADLIAWVDSVKAAGIAICLVSNNWHERVSTVARRIDVTYVTKAVKPLPFAFIVAMRRLKVTRKQTVMVGDQLFTDVLGGRLMGICTVMVLPLAQYDLAHTLFLRKVERIVLKGRTPGA